MIRLLGYSAVAAALALAVYGIAAAVWGVRARQAALIRSARAAAYVNAALLLGANALMVYALLTHDFSISYVAQVGSRTTPAWVSIVSLWSSLEGSILFWGMVLAAYTAGAMYFTRSSLGALGAYANAVMLAVGAFFYLLLVGPANPFAAVFPVPIDGPGPNPLLQNHYLMAVHPPLLYLGYVGMTVPFGFAMGALLSGRLDDTWLRVTRRWTLTAWMFLSLAIMAGMWWSYDVLGWGGYWAWDPVENASFMPWLTATAFLHSAMVQERRGMLRVWNLALIVGTFLLTVLGTFLTRSGVLSSVHAFSEGPIGMYFLVFMALVLVFSLALLAGRSTELKSTGNLDSMVSRESVFLLNNLLLAAFAFTVLLGTLYPLLAEALRGVKVSVGGPFFNKMTLPICAALLFLVGVGPMLPWRVADRQQLKRTAVAPGVGLVLALALALAAGVRSGYGLLAFAFAGFALVSNVQEFALAAAARRRHSDLAPVAAFLSLFRVNPRRFGGYTAHLGIIIAAIGITASSEFRTERQATMKPGDTIEIAQYRLRFDDLQGHEEPHRFVVAANFSIMAGERPTGTMNPRLNYYTARGGEPVTTPSVRSRARNDLYMTLLAFEQDGSSATISVIVEPLVSWIWVGGFIVAMGAILAMRPARERRAAAAPRPQRTPVEAT